MAQGFACGECGWEWLGDRPPTDPGPCGAHVGGVPCPTPEAFTEAKRHWDAGCNHVDEECRVAN